MVRPKDPEMTAAEKTVCYSHFPRGGGGIPCPAVMPLQALHQILFGGRPPCAWEDIQVVRLSTASPRPGELTYTAHARPVVASPDLKTVPSPRKAESLIKLLRTQGSKRIEFQAIISLWSLFTPQVDRGELESLASAWQGGAAEEKAPKRDIWERWLIQQH